MPRGCEEGETEEEEAPGEDVHLQVGSVVRWEGEGREEKGERREESGGRREGGEKERRRGAEGEEEGRGEERGE